jgi:hypothetical protein
MKSSVSAGVVEHTPTRENLAGGVIMMVAGSMILAAA